MHHNEFSSDTFRCLINRIQCYKGYQTIRAFCLERNVGLAEGSPRIRTALGLHPQLAGEPEGELPLSVRRWVKLQQQALSGTVSGLSGSAPTTFTLTAAADSAFAMLSGSTTVTIYWQPGTDVHNLPHVLTNGDVVRVRGLVFFTGSGFSMIARRITQ